LNVGDKVCVIPYISCGNCISCRKGKPGSCESLRVAGVHFDGGMSEYCVMPVENVIKIPQDMDPFKAALIEPMAISAHAVHIAKVKNGENILVFWCRANWFRHFGNSQSTWREYHCSGY